VSLPFPRSGFRVDELLIRPPVLDDVAAIAPAFLDPDVGGEAGLPPLTEPELRTFMQRDLPAMQESGFLTPFVIIEGRGTIAGGITLHHYDEQRSRIRPENERSIRVLERLGFTREGRLRRLLRYRDGRADAFIYSLLPGE